MPFKSTKSWAGSLSGSSMKGEEKNGGRNWNTPHFSLYGRVGATVAVATFSFVARFLRTVGVGHVSSMLDVMEASLKMTAVASAPNPSRPTNLFDGFDLVPPRLVRLWYMVRAEDPGALAMMIKSTSLTKFPVILAPNSASLMKVESVAKLSKFLFASSFE